jgi:class 3 adenylate cyclase
MAAAFRDDRPSGQPGGPPPGGPAGPPGEAAAPQGKAGVLPGEAGGPAPGEARRAEAIALEPPRLWQRLGVRLAVFLAAVTLAAVGLVGGLIYQRHQSAVEETVGTQLLNIARTSALLVDPALHAEVQRTGNPDSDPYRRLRAALAAVQTEILVPTPLRTLADYDAAGRQARVVIASAGTERPGDPYPLAPELVEPMGWTLADGVARFTGLYRSRAGMRISAFAPIPDAAGQPVALLIVDYPVQIYLDRLDELRATIVQVSLGGALATLALGLLFARRLTRPITRLTGGVTRVAAGDLSQPLPVVSRDEVGQLTRAFNAMLEGLRQRDFIRDTFGRYVSPEVARTVLDSPDGLRLGGEKRDVTVLMSDLRGYTRFTEEADPALVVQVLNQYLGRMTDIITAHAGTINEFTGDGIVAFFGAPLPHRDHAERAAACALAMQLAMDELAREHAARGLPRLEMGIGLNSGEAIVGNVGSEKRAKYSAVGSVINLAARVEAFTVGGQILLSPLTYARVRDLVEVRPPLEAEVKGVREPLSLYELRAIGGPWARRLPEAAAGVRDLAAALPVRCWLIEGKVVRPEAIAGEVVAVGTGLLVARLGTRLAPLANVRLRVRYAAEAPESGDLYGKILSVSEAGGAWVTGIRVTSADPADQQRLEALGDSNGARAG